MPPVHARALKQAAEILGGREELAKLLNVPSFILSLWMQGRGAPPLSTFLAAVDVIYHDAQRTRDTQPRSSLTKA